MAQITFRTLNQTGTTHVCVPKTLSIQKVGQIICYLH